MVRFARAESTASRESTVNVVLDVTTEMPVRIPAESWATRSYQLAGLVSTAKRLYWLVWRTSGWSASRK